MQALLKYLLTGNFRATAGSTKNKSLVKTASDKSKLVQREQKLLNVHTSAEVATSSEYITQYVTYRTGILDGLRKK